MGRINRFLALPSGEKLSLAEAAILLMLARLSVKVVPFRYIHRFLNGRWSRRLPDTHSRGQGVESAFRALTRAEGLFTSPSLCLPRSIAAYMMLRRRGVSATVVLGVRSFPADHSSLDAHAWICVDNAPIDYDPTREGYTALVTIGQRPTFGTSPLG